MKLEKTQKLKKVFEIARVGDCNAKIRKDLETETNFKDKILIKELATVIRQLICRSWRL